MSRHGLETLVRRMPPGWHSRLRQGVSAHLHACVDAEGREIPLNLVVQVELQATNELAIRVEPASNRRDVTEVDGRVATLTARERAVIDLVATGNETAQIAGRLYISPETVRTHVRNAMEKVGARTRAQLVAIVLTGGRSQGAA